MIYYGTKTDLRPLDDIPTDKMLAWRNDYRIWRHCRQNDLITEASHLRWYDKQVLAEENKMYGVFNHKKNDAVGICGITSIDNVNRRGEFSLYIAPEFQENGFGKDALKTLLHHAFNCLNLNCVWGESFAYNPAREMFKSVGMKEDGLRRQFYFRDGKYVDAYLYSILRGEWENQFTSKERIQCSI